MNKTLLGATLLLAYSGFAALSANATDSVTVNGMTFTCTNQCNVTTSGGTTTVTDCCGGRVSGTFQAPAIIEN